MKTKICAKCSERKTLDEFHLSSGGNRDGRQSYCIPCAVEGKQARIGIRARDIEHVRRDPVGNQDDGDGWNRVGLGSFGGGVGIKTGLAANVPKPHKNAALLAQIAEIPCPCCGHAVVAPTLAQIVDHYKIAPQSARLLEAVWRGRGLPVSSERIQDFMWSDDPDGGPPEARAYRYFQWSLHDLRAKLKGSGVAVVNAGYRSGYRLVMGVAQKET